MTLRRGRGRKSVDMTLRRGRGRKAAGGLAAAGVAAAVLAGCAVASSSPPGTGVPATSTAASASAPPASHSPASSAPSGAAGTPACSSSGLRVSLGSASGAAGSLYRYIEFKNVSASSCTLYGFPGVSLLADSPARQIGAAATRAANSHPTLVTLRPGGTASALMRVANALNFPAETCHPVASTTLRVYPPNQTASQALPYASTGCAATSVKLIQVNAVQPGTGSPPGATS